MEYDHTQRGHLHLVLYAAAAAEILLSWLVRDNLPAAMIVLAVAALFVVLAEMFRTLTVRDEGEHMAIRYGPIPLFRTRLRYADVTHVEPGRSTLLDGWGIHYFPGRGWTYNLWGFDCVTLKLGRKTIRIGTDDMENLAAFLRTKTAEIASDAKIGAVDETSTSTP